MDHYDSARKRSKPHRRSAELFETQSSSSHGSDDLLQPLGNMQHRSSKHRRRSDAVVPRRETTTDPATGMSLLADFGPETSRESMRHRHHKHKHRRRSDRPVAYPEQRPDLVPAEQAGHRSRSSQGSVGSDGSTDGQSRRRGRESSRDDLAGIYLTTKESMVILYSFPQKIAKELE